MLRHIFSLLVVLSVSLMLASCSSLGLRNKSYPSQRSMKPENRKVDMAIMSYVMERVMFPPPNFVGTEPITFADSAFFGFIKYGPNGEVTAELLNGISIMKTLALNGSENIVISHNNAHISKL